MFDAFLGNRRRHLYLMMDIRGKTKYRSNKRILSRSLGDKSKGYRLRTVTLDS